MGSILMNTRGKEMKVLDKQTKDILVAILELENKSFKSWQDEMVESNLMSIFMRKGEDYNLFRNWVLEKEAQKTINHFLSEQLDIPQKKERKKAIDATNQQEESEEK